MSPFENTDSKFQLYLKKYCTYLLTACDDNRQFCDELARITSLSSLKFVLISYSPHRISRAKSFTVR
jgi:hypothetical protein